MNINNNQMLNIPQGQAPPCQTADLPTETDMVNGIRNTVKFNKFKYPRKIAVIILNFFKETGFNSL